MMLGIRGGTGGGACDYFASKERGEGGGAREGGGGDPNDKVVTPAVRMLECLVLSYVAFKL